MKGSIRRSAVVVGAALMLLGAVQTASASANVSGWQKVKGLSPIDSSSSKTARAYCPAGKRAIGGGGASSGTSSTTPATSCSRACTPCIR